MLFKGFGSVALSGVGSGGVAGTSPLFDLKLAHTVALIALELEMVAVELVSMVQSGSRVFDSGVFGEGVGGDAEELEDKESCGVFSSKVLPMARGRSESAKSRRDK